MTQHNINWKQLAAACAYAFGCAAIFSWRISNHYSTEIQGWVVLAGLAATTILRTLNAVTVSPYHLFVMADNRFDAFDSRRFGPSPISSSLPKMR